MINEGYITNPKDLKGKNDCVYQFERDVNETLWYHYLQEKIRNGDDIIETKCFIIRPYSWNEEKPELNDWHFLHKGSNFRIQWYKYPLRSPMVNWKITHEEFLDILKDCWNFWERDHHGMSYYDCYKWWTRTK